MSTKIYVGNLPWRVTDAQLSQLFSAHGDVSDARVVTDRETGRSRGFAFVTMDSAEGAGAAIQALNGYSMEGRALVVNEANEQGRPGGGGAGGMRRPMGAGPRNSPYGPSRGPRGN